VLHSICWARAHSFLSRCAFPHYNLASVAAFTTRLAAYADTLTPEDMLLVLCTDVKEMYTGMQHAATLDATQFMLDHYCARHMRAGAVSVAPGWRSDIYSGDSRALGALVFPLSALLPSVRCELSNLYFTVGADALLRSPWAASLALRAP
jgi:hypothetical protein